MIYSDWHIHTDASYDARLPLETLIAAAKAQGLRGFGITDHLNYEDEKFWGNIVQSAENYHRLKDQLGRKTIVCNLLDGIDKQTEEYRIEHHTLPVESADRLGRWIMRQ